MLVGRVTGNVVSTNKVDSLRGAKLLIVQPVALDTLEMKDETCRPAIADSVDLAQYDVVFVGFPIWWGIAPRIIETFLENYDFAGKTVVPFCTSGGSGVGKTDAVLHKLCPPTVHWKPCKKLSAAASQRELGAWLQSLQL